MGSAARGGTDAAATRPGGPARVFGRFTSLRWRLTFLYVALLAGLLGLLGVVQYFALRQVLIRGEVDLMRTNFNTVNYLWEHDNAPPPPPPRPPSPRPSPGASPSAPRPSPSPPAALRSPIPKMSQAFADELKTRRISVRLLGPNGFPRYQSPKEPGADIPLLSGDEYLHALRQGGQADYVVPSQSITGRTYLVILERFPPDVRAKPNGLVQLSVSTDNIQRVLARDLDLYLLGSLGILLLAVVLSPLITARALKPLERMGRTAAALASGDYKQRVNLPGRRDEVGKLAQAFDEMAARIDHAFEVRRQSEERMRQFVADASHELRTPLTAIGGYLDVLLRRSQLDPDTVQSALTAMQRESARMNRLVNDLLQLARIEGGYGLRAEPFALDAVVSQTLDEMALPVPVERRLEPLRVVGDADAIKQVVTNLAQNAMKYAPGAAQEWSCLSVNGTATLRVRDRGPGIPGSDLPHIFERFYRGEKMRGRHQGGSGLGLAIVKSIVEAQGGKVEATSAPGEGATFTITLPVPR